MTEKCNICGTYILNAKCGCNLSLLDISEPVDPELMPYLDFTKDLNMAYNDHMPPLNFTYKREWYADGATVLKMQSPAWIELIDEYNKVREGLPDIGWSAGTPYMHVPELRNLFCYDLLSDYLKTLIGDEMGLHLNLTGWVSTRRAMHQDDYLNPPFINSWYAGVWIACDDVHPDSGPFQYYKGSHWMPFIRQHKIMPYIPVELRNGSDWVYQSEPWTSRILENECKELGLELVTYLPKKGDVLVWHSRLAHTGSVPANPLLKRKSVIGHFSALTKRMDMPHRARNNHPQSHGWYFML